MWKKVVVAMRENPKTKQSFSVSRHFWVLACGIALMPIFGGQALAETFTLDSIDFRARGGQTDIVLHTGSIVPVDKIMVSDTKLILDIDQINAHETIRTNFAQAQNISHVIMQPLGDHKLRMIIRGDGLGMPNVAFLNTNNGTYSTGNPAYDNPRLADENATALHALQENGMQSAALGETSATESILPANDIDAPLPAVDDVLPQRPAPTGKLKPETGNADTLAPLSLSETSSGGNVPGFFEALAKPAAAKHYEPYIPYALLGLVILGLGGFVIQRIRRFRRGERQLEDYLQPDMAADEPSNRKTGFREMASAYRNKHARNMAQAPDSTDLTPPSKPVGKKDMIGLGSLKQMESAHQASTNEGADATRTLETLLAAMQATNMPKKPVAPTSAPRKQAVGQYAKTQPQQGKIHPALDLKLLEETKRREEERARQVQATLQKQAQAQPKTLMDIAKSVPKSGVSQPVNRALAAKKRSPVTHPSQAAMMQPKPAMPRNSQQGPLPGNPEVLNFLRNVADLMEKDGKTEMARSIHKNLNGQNLELI